MSTSMHEGEVAELVGKTLEWAAGQTGLPAITAVESRDLGEVDIRLIDGSLWRLTAQVVDEGGSS